jgi:hypothetical protein
MQPVTSIHEAGGEQSTATEYMDLMAFKRTSFRFQMLQTYGVSSEKKAFQEFRKTGVYDVPSDNPRLIRQRGQLTGGRVLQRVQLVVLPLSDYIRFSFVYFNHFARAGEDIRIIDTSKASIDGLPDYDFVLLDDELVIKLSHSGKDGSVIEQKVLANADIAEFRAYRDRALDVAIPFADYAAQADG